MASNENYIKSPRLKKLYRQFLRRKAHCPEHSGKWWRLDKRSNSVILNYRPLRIARSFHLSDAKHRAFGGGYGDGKSLALCQEALTLCFEYPGCLGLIGCATYPQLKDATLATFNEICPPELIAKRVKTPVPDIWFKNGSHIMFRALSTKAMSEDDKSKFKNMNLGFFAMDQAEGIEEEVYELLSGRLRQVCGPRRAFIVFNMEGHNWIYKCWVKEVRSKKRNPRDWQLFVAKSIENPYLPKDYVFELLASNSEEWVERFVEGSFDAFKGKIFKDFSEQDHVIEEFPLPVAWTRYRSIDWGDLNPFCCLFAAVSPENDLYIYGEIYEKRVTVPVQASLIKSSNYGMYRDEHGRTHPYNFAWTTIDPHVNTRDPTTGITLKDTYALNGVYTTNANNDVSSGIDRINSLFRGKRPFRTIKIMRNCANLIDEIQNYRYRARTMDGKEKPQKVHDHAVDALRYLVMSDPSHDDITKQYDNEEDFIAEEADEYTGY
jgi:PBSX family phage terminase large subunit